MKTLKKLMVKNENFKKTYYKISKLHKLIIKIAKLLTNLKLLFDHINIII